MDFDGNCVPFGPRGGGRRRRSVRSGVVRSIGLFVLALASVAALPPYCTPIPTEAVADLHEDCIRPLCDPASGACAFAQRLPDGTPCADGAGVCASGRCDCRAACGERVCGPDGCGGSCGACAEEEFCSVGECIPEGVGPGPHPQLVGTFPAAAQAIAVKGDTGYLGAGDHLFVLDLSDPEHPRELGRLVLPAPPARIVPDPRRPYVYVGYSPAYGLGVVDVSQRRAPRLVHTALADRAVTPGPWYRDLLYAGVSVPDPERPGGWWRGSCAVSFEDPLRPLLHELPEGTVLASVIRERYGYALWSDGLHVVELRDPLAPNTLRVVPVPSEHALRVLAFAGDQLVGAGSVLVVFDLSDPAAPRLRSAVPYPHWEVARGLAVVGDTAYVVGDCAIGLSAFDLRDPDAPVLLLRRFGTDCRWHPSHVDPYYSLEIAAADDAAWFAYGPNGLQGWRQDEPGTVPRRAGTFHTVGVPVSLQEHEGLIVVASSRPGVTLLDVSGTVSPTASAAHPEIVGSFELTGAPWPAPDDETVFDAPSLHSAVASGHRVYVGHDEKLLVLGIDDPTRPELLAALPVPFTFDPTGNGMLVVGDGFVACAPAEFTGTVVTVITGEFPGGHERREWEFPWQWINDAVADDVIWALASASLVSFDPVTGQSDFQIPLAPDFDGSNLTASPSAFWISDRRVGLQIVQRQQGAVPRFLGTVALSEARSTTRSVSVREPYVYVPYNFLPSVDLFQGAIDTLQISETGMPELAGTLLLSEKPVAACAVSGRQLLVPTEKYVALYGPEGE